MEYIILALISCYGLSADQQSYCQARERHDVSACYSISDSALRESCRAEIHQQPWLCNKTDPEERQLCRNKAGK